MRPRRHRAGKFLALLLICIGAVGILLSPSAGLAGARESKSFTVPDLAEHDWGAAVVLSEVELPWITNSRGLYLMHGLIVASMITLFSGVHLLAARRKPATVA